MTTEIIYQFRVTWRRSDFSPKTGDRVKTFSSEGRALAFLAKLKGPGRAPPHRRAPRPQPRGPVGTGPVGAAVTRPPPPWPAVRAALADDAELAAAVRRVLDLLGGRVLAVRRSDR